MPEPVFTCDWFGQNIEPLTKVLAKFKDYPNIHALEIGCFEGRGTLWLMDNILTHATSSIMCVDTFDGSAEHVYLDVKFGPVFERFLANIKDNPRINFWRGRSADFLKELNTTYDIIYIDGSHLAPDVLNDIVFSWPLLKPGGVMFMDDYEWPGTDAIEIHRPKPAIDAFLYIYSEQHKVLHKGYSVAVEKIA